RSGPSEKRSPLQQSETEVGVFTPSPATAESLPKGLRPVVGVGVTQPHTFSTPLASHPRARGASRELRPVVGMGVTQPHTFTTPLASHPRARGASKDPSPPKKMNLPVFLKLTTIIHPFQTNHEIRNASFEKFRSSFN
ncbi:hypothetical protein AVEN_207566-1, partial [Araneus ventricosus]